ncbi:hypothetical protein ACQW02_25395 [Humitalea sp. 24SJ18S-53]|uniref:hypothetical protein n=1 Tax=Humitalea sp. 24SJ18S-53 TaxID=3422307 RepID=UPI003D66D8B8
MSIQPHRTQWTLVVRGGGLPPGDQVETFPDAAAAQDRLRILRTTAAQKGEPLVSRIMPPKGHAQ